MFSGIFGKPPPASIGEKALQMEMGGDDDKGKGKGSGGGGGGGGRGSGLFDPTGLER